MILKITSIIFFLISDFKDLLAWKYCIIVFPILILKGLCHEEIYILPPSLVQKEQTEWLFLFNQHFPLIMLIHYSLLT